MAINYSHCLTFKFMRILRDTNISRIHILHALMHCCTEISRHDIWNISSGRCWYGYNLLQSYRHCIIREGSSRVSKEREYHFLNRFIRSNLPETESSYNCEWINMMFPPKLSLSFPKNYLYVSPYPRLHADTGN